MNILNLLTQNFTSKLDYSVEQLCQALEAVPNIGCKNDFELTHIKDTISYQEAVKLTDKGIAIEFIPITSNHFKWINLTEKNIANISSALNPERYLYRIKPNLSLEQAVIYLYKGEKVTYTIGKETKGLKLSDLTTRFIKKNPIFKLIPNKE